MIFPSFIGSCFPAFKAFVGVPGALPDSFEGFRAVVSEMKDEYDKGFPSCARRSLVATIHQSDQLPLTRPPRLTFTNPILSVSLQHNINMERPLRDRLACLTIPRAC